MSGDRLKETEGMASSAADDSYTTSAHQHRLDELVTRIAVRLMPVAASTLDEALQWAIQELGEFFGADTAFLRRHEHDRGVSVLLAEWPRRDHVPEPDPLGVVPFDADPVFAASRHLLEPLIVRPTDAPDYQHRIDAASGRQTVAMATVPLVHNDVTEGVLGFVSFDGRDWTTNEVNALQAIASLLLQLQARIAAEEQLQYNAYHDELTGLANRRAVLAELEDRIEHAPGGSVGVLLINLDRMKVLNDALGHRLGDRLLIAVADRLDALTRRQDLVGRIGGDEFIVVLGDPIDDAEARWIAERLLRVLGEPFDLDGQLLTRTCSIGIGFGRVRDLTGEALLAEADAALYSAKTRGRNQVAVFDDQLRDAVNRRFETEQELRRALALGELRLHYQPEVDLATGELVACEALLRWEHPTRGLLTAGGFIDIAEESGLVVEIGRWVLHEAARQAAEWLELRPDLVVRVNVSPAQLMVQDIVAVVVDALAHHRVPSRSLCLEVTEHAVVQDMELVIGVLEELRDTGIHIAIDDFGTGYSSMTQLKRLPADTLKIDQTFVAGLGSDERDEAIVQATVALATNLGMDLVGEGVETAGHARRLLQLGCRRAQGYFLARPAPPHELHDLIAGERRLTT